jgi:sucrose phosphorylase
MDRRQSIFCISNISCSPQSLDLSGVNLIDTEDWRELISGATIEGRDRVLELQPYQTVWISNTPDPA